MQRTDLLLPSSVETMAVDGLSIKCQTALIFQTIQVNNSMCLQIAPSNRNVLTNQIIRVDP